MFDGNHLSIRNGSNPLLRFQYIKQRFCDLKEKISQRAASCDCHMDPEVCYNVVRSTMYPKHLVSDIPKSKCRWPAFLFFLCVP